VLDECAYIEKKTLLNIITPILMEKTSALICASTQHEDEENGFNQLMKSGNYPVIQISYVCEQCYDLGLKTVCKHMVHDVPPWMAKDIQLLSKLDGVSQEAFMREFLGFSNNDPVFVFSPESIERLNNAPRFLFATHTPYIIHVCIDPCAGSEDPLKSLSDFAIVSITTPKITIIGIDAFKVNKPEDYKEILLAHIATLKCRFTSASFVFDIEAGTGLEAGHIQNLIESNTSIKSTFLSDFKNKPGTNTTNATKLDMMKMTLGVMDKGEIQFADSIVTSRGNETDIKNQLLSQLKFYQRKIIPGKTEDAKNKIILSGKQNGAKDDLCVTLQRAIRNRIRSN
jgi:hypothetical protein